MESESGLSYSDYVELLASAAPPLTEVQKRAVARLIESAQANEMAADAATAVEAQSA